MIKSIQRGVMTFAKASDAEVTATISSVNPSKAVVMYGGHTGTGNSSTMDIALELVNSTTVKAYRTNTINLPSIPYQVVEYY